MLCLLPEVIALHFSGLEVPTRPSQMMARNRLDCAKRMLGYARQSIRQMENPTDPQQPSTAAQSSHPLRPPRRGLSVGDVMARMTETRGTLYCNTFIVSWHLLVVLWSQKYASNFPIFTLTKY